MIQLSKTQLDAAVRRLNEQWISANGGTAKLTPETIDRIARALLPAERRRVEAEDAARQADL